MRHGSISNNKEVKMSVANISKVLGVKVPTVSSILRKWRCDSFVIKSDTWECKAIKE